MITPTAAPSLASAPPNRSLAPPAKFGRLAKDASDLHTDALAGPLSVPPATVEDGYRPRTLSVHLDDPAAAARSLQTHMEPAELMELIYILAEAAADVLREQKKQGKAKGLVQRAASAGHLKPHPHAGHQPGCSEPQR
jgi:hypothetical protein